MSEIKLPPMPIPDGTVYGENRSIIGHAILTEKVRDYARAAVELNRKPQPDQPAAWSTPKPTDEWAGHCWFTIHETEAKEWAAKGWRVDALYKQQPAAGQPVIQGVMDSRCNYLAFPDHGCNKCGNIHDGKPQAQAEPVAAIIYRGTDDGVSRDTVVLLDTYDPRKPEFWADGKMPENYSFDLLYTHPAPVADQGPIVFLDQSSADYLTKAKRVLNGLINGADYRYFFEDGFPKARDIATDCSAVLTLLERYTHSAPREAVPKTDSFLKERAQLEQEWCELRKLKSQYERALGLKTIVQDGWKLVPIEPTQEMLDSGYYPCIQNRGAKSVWATMLAAAPNHGGEQ